MILSRDVLTGGTISTDSVQAGFPAANAIDDNSATRFSSDVGVGFGAPLPHYLKYDFGAGITRRVRYLNIKGADVSGGGGDIGIKDFTLQGSNDDSSYTVIYTGSHAQNENYQSYFFPNSTSYRYYKLNVTTVWGSTYTYMSLWELEMKELIPSAAIM